VVSASLFWFLSLTMIVSIFRTRFDAKVLRLINLLCGVVILFYAGKLLLNFLNLLEIL
jgi:Lysine efflux permease